MICEDWTSYVNVCEITSKYTALKLDKGLGENPKPTVWRARTAKESEMKEEILQREGFALRKNQSQQIELKALIFPENVPLMLNECFASKR